MFVTLYFPIMMDAKIYFICALLPSCLSLDNGLALTPPMGWLTWERFRCITDCISYPDDCISENLIKRIADLMVTEGYLAAGYEYVIVDDCWLEKVRGIDGRLVPDRTRFPGGMRSLSDYVHSKGLKFGLYQDYGLLTCGLYPGIAGHEAVDAETFASWGVDYIKLDGCYSDPRTMDIGYPNFGNLLNETGRPIVYSCSWPFFQYKMGIKPNFTAIAQSCNLWRLHYDIQDSWNSFTSIVDWVSANQENFTQFAGPGRWNDPDMLIIGNYGLSEDQAQVQMALWAVLAAPLMMSVDLATIKPQFKKILLNKEIIAVSKDELGKQGTRVYQENGIEVWTRVLSGGSYAVAFVNRRDYDGAPYSAIFTFEDMRLAPHDYDVQDLYEEKGRLHLAMTQSFTVRVNPSGVKFYKFIRKSFDEHMDSMESLEAVNVNSVEVNQI